jgi:large subunit ribosomal protein L21
MYAIIETGGKQYTVEEGMTLSVEKLAAEAGSEVTFDRVLFVGGDAAPKIGTPTVEGAAVTGTVLKQARDRKVTVYHKKRRKGYEKKYGHRQPYTDVKVTKISA